MFRSRIGISELLFLLKTFYVFVLDELSFVGYHELMEPVVVNTPQPVPQVVTINTHVVKKRIFAALIDSIIWAIILMILSSMFGETSVGMNGEDGPGASFNLSGFPALVYGAAAFAYYVGLEWKKGGTLGKKIMKIHVANMH